MRKLMFFLLSGLLFTCFLKAVNQVEVKAPNGYPIHNLDTGLNYTTIQEAIDAPETLGGHTIFVEEGTYHENVIMYKHHISLVGENKIDTFIDGSNNGTVVDVSGDHVNITGFTIQNSGGLDFGIILSNVDCCNITGNNVANNWRGIRLENCPGNIIFGNNMTANNYDGISLYNSSGNTVYGNDMINNGFGVHLSDSPSNTICGNNMTNNDFGIFLEQFSNNNLISGNKLTSNSCGIRLHFLLSNNTISGNNITDSSDGIYFWHSSNNIISGNNITSNDNGITLDSCVNNVISENYIVNNGDGIYFWHSSGNNIYNNNFVSNNRHVNDCESISIWDNGYPCCGNYWNNYAGVDERSGPNQGQLGSDGIGDAPYNIDETNMDNYPLFGMFSDFNATSEHNIQTVCNSTISGFQFNSTAIFFSVTGENGTIGFCRVCIPHKLISPPYNVIINNELTAVLHEYSYDDVTYIYFTYPHSPHKVTIVTEFPSFIILPLFMMATLLVAIIYKRKHLVYLPLSFAHNCKVTIETAPYGSFWP
jgi:parallel beta-helix repeat protein